MRRVRRSLAVFFGLSVAVSIGVGVFLATTANAGPCDVATKTWDRGANTDAWNDAANWAPDGVPAAGSHVCLTAGSPGALVVASSPVSIGSVESAKPVRVQSAFEVTSTSQTSVFASLELQGDLQGAGDRTVSGALSWRSGSIAGAGTTTVAASGSLTVEAVSYSRTLSSTLITNGTVDQPNYNSFVSLQDGTWNHTGTWTMATPSASSATLLTISGGTNLIHNTGTITKTGNNTITLAAPLDNDGTLTTTGGTLSLGNGTQTDQQPTGDYTANGGTLSIDTPLTLADSATLGATSGTVALDATLTADGDVSVPAGRTLTWRSGTIDGTGTTTVEPGATLDIEAVPYSRTLSSTLITNGTVNQPNYNSFVSLQDGTWNHTGTWTMATPSASTATLLTINGGTNLIHNTGTITKTGNNTITLAAPLDNDGTLTTTGGTLRSVGVLADPAKSTGTWAASAGAVLEVGGQRLAGGTATGAGIVSMVDEVRAGGEVTVTPGATLRVDGALEVADTLTVDGALSWRSGSIAGAGTTTVAASGSLTVEAVSYSRTLSSTLITNGTVDQPNYNSFVSLQDGTWNHTGTWTMATPSASSATLLTISGGTNLIHNTGTITKTGNNTITLAAPLDNDGTLTTTGGTLSLGNGTQTDQQPTGDYTANGGTLSIDTPLTLADSATLGATSGTVALDATLTADGDVSVPAGRTLTWRSGTIDGTGTTTVEPGATLDIEAVPYSRTLSSTLITNGTVNQPNYNSFVSLQDGTWNHTGTWTMATPSASTATLLTINGGTNLIHNTGTITKTGNNTITLAAPLDNDGTLTTTGGTLVITEPADYDAGTDTLSGGTWVAQGGILSFPSIPTIATADATFVVDGAASSIRTSANTSVLPAITAITTQGGLTLRHGQNVALAAPLTTAGAVTIGETSSLTVAGLYRQTNGTTRLEHSTANLTATGSRVEVQGGTLQGVGTIAPELRSTGGTIAPGNSAGALFVSGPIDLDASARVEVEINGAVVGTEYDRLQASGAVSVDGTLAITKGAAYDPALGQTFDVVTGASRTGTFSGVTPSSAGVGRGFDVTYPAGKVSLEVVAVPGQDLVVSAAPVGTAFNVGFPGTWRTTVRNVGGAATSGTVTATLTPGAGQTIDTATGTGWSCSGSGPVTCTRANVVPSGGSLPPIELRVDVSAPAQPSTTLTVAVSGGGDTRPGNNGFTTGVVVRNVVPPVAQLQLSSTKGTAPFAVTADSTLSTGTITGRSFDWGDGTSSSGFVASHTYSQPGTYTVTLRVENDVQSATRTLRVTVLEDTPLTARAGDDRSAAPGLTLQFDGGGSLPTGGIDTFAWDFGDGDNTAPSAAATAFHSYSSPGTYTVTLTVTRGAETSTDMLTVTVEEAVGTGLSIDVTGSGNPLPGADVTVIDGKGVRYSAVAGLGGNALLRGLPDGSYTAYAWADGFLPKTAPVTVVGGNGNADIDLASGAIATQTLESRRLTYDEIVAAGIDPADPANQNVFEFELCLAFGDYSCIPFEGIGNATGEIFFPVFGGGPGGGSSGSCSADSCTWRAPEGRITASFSTSGGQPTVTFLLIPGEARWLKEFFEVKMAVVNLAPPGFTFEDGVSTLDLPEGLALAPTSDPQSLDVDLDDIPGGESRTATWVIRGDEEGEYDLTASYSGTLDPIGKSIKLDATTAEPLKVWGGSAVEMTVIADDAAVAHEPYRFTLRIENVTAGSSDPAPIYNPVLAIHEDAGGSNYIVQPGERFEQGTDVLEPGETFDADFVVVPTFSGTLNVAGSAVFWLAGDEAPATTITSQPRLPALDVTSTALPGQVQLDWTPTAGAVEYRVYRTPTDVTRFPVPAPPLVTTTATTATVAAPQGAQWYVVSTVYADGVQEMRHEMIQAAPAPPPAGPSISIGSANVLEANAGKARNAQLAVVLSEPSNQPVTVKYAIEADGGGTAASPGSDFKTKTGTLTFKPSGTGLTPTTRYVTAQALPDIAVEGDETFQVRLFDPSPGYSLANAIGAVTIIDDDPSSGLRVSIGDGSMPEGDSSIKATSVNNGKVWITFSQPVTSTTTVRVTISAGTATAGSDFKVVKTKLLTFKPGQFQKAVSVPVYPDAAPEGDETVTVTLSEPSAGLTIAKAVGTLTILDDD